MWRSPQIESKRKLPIIFQLTFWTIHWLLFPKASSAKGRTHLAERWDWANVPRRQRDYYSCPLIYSCRWCSAIISCAWRCTIFAPLSKTWSGIPPSFAPAPTWRFTWIFNRELALRLNPWWTRMGNHAVLWGNSCWRPSILCTLCYYYCLFARPIPSKIIPVGIPDWRTPPDRNAGYGRPRISVSIFYKIGCCRPSR